MTIISQPEVNVTKIGSTATQSNEPQRVLIVGPMVAAGTATSGVLQTSIPNDNSEDTLFGANSLVAGMVRAFKKINQVTRLDVIPLDDNGAGVAATGTFAFTGPATAAGTITVNIGSRSNHSYDIAVASGDTATDIGDALDVLVLADTDAPFSSNNVTGTVTITADNDGTEGNYIGLEVIQTSLPTGVGVTVTGMASGATNPVLTNVFDVIAGERYQTIVMPASWGYDEVTTLLDARWNTNNDILDGVAIVSKTSSLADLKSNEGTENSRSLVPFGNKLINNTYYKGSMIFELDTIISCYFAAIRSLRLTDNSNISQFIVTTAGLLDTRGGSAIASLPYFNTPFALLPVIDQGIGWTTTEIEELADVGVSVLGNNTGRTSIISGEIYTTYLTDAASNPDTTWQFLNSVDTASNVAEFIFNNLKSDFSQSRLTEGDLIPGRAMANEAKIRAAMVGYYNTLSGEDYTLVEAGADALKFFKENLTVTVTKSTGTVTVTCKTPIVTQTRTFNVTIQTVFSTNS